MNFERVLEYFKDVLLSLRLEGISENEIAVPNRAFKAIGKTLWFEISLATGEETVLTEHTEIIPVVANLIVCVPANGGTKRANKIAAAIRNKFSASDASKIVAFSVADGNEETRFYIAGVSQLTGAVVDGVYKINVRASIDAWKER